MKIESINGTISPGNKRKHEEILMEYDKLMDRSTDVLVPVYALTKDNFEKVWPLYGVDSDECGWWRHFIRSKKVSSQIVRENYDLEFDNDPCSGSLTAECVIAFVNDIQYDGLRRWDFIESPGIYIKDSFTINDSLYDFVLSYNVHLAETYYLSNRKSVIVKGDSRNVKHFGSFIITLLTLKSLYRKNEKQTKDLIHNQSSRLVGSWKVPFILLNNIHENTWKDVFKSDEITSAIEDMCGGAPLGDVNARIVKIMEEF